MKTGARLLALSMLLALALLTSWRVVATAMSDRLAAEHPQQALEWDHDNPLALAALAQQQLDQRQTRAAQETALRLLAHEPLAGQGFVLLSEVAQADGDEARSMRFSRIAIRHAPSAAGPRAWVIGEQLRQGHYTEALENLSRMLRSSPGKGGLLSPLLIQLADNPEFADALASELAEEPAWRKGFISVVTSKGSAQAVNQLLTGVQRRSGLDPAEMERWIARLARDGKWSEAYARWVGEIEGGVPNRLTRVYNGGFEIPPSGAGFDWRIADSAGVVIDRDTPPGAEGSFALRLTFMGRRIDAIPLHQWLLLAPGSYRLRFRANLNDLRSDRGLQWLIRCQGSRTELAASGLLNGNFGWQAHDFEFEIPQQGCLGQDLSLRNTGSEGAGKVVLGTIWFDEVAIDRIDGSH